LLDLSHKPADSSLKPYSLRPAGVDPKYHEEIHDWIPRLQAAKAVYMPAVLGLARTVYAAGVSPTRDLGRVLVELAMGDGDPLVGGGVSGEGRTISNGGMKKLAGI